MKRFVCFVMVFIFAPKNMEFCSINFANIQKIDSLGNVSYSWFYPLNKEPSLIFFNTSKRSSILDTSSNNNLTVSPKSSNVNSVTDSPKSSCGEHKEDLFIENDRSLLLMESSRFDDIDSASSEIAQFSNLVETFQLALSVNFLDGSFSDYEGRTENNSCNSTEEEDCLESISSLDSLNDEKKIDTSLSDVFEDMQTSGGNFSKNNGVKPKDYSADPLYYRYIQGINSSYNIRTIHQNKLKKLIDLKKTSNSV